MLVMLSLLRFLAATRWSTLMAFLGMLLAVASIVAVHLVSVQVGTRLDALIPESLRDYGLLLHRDGLQSADYFELRRQWRRGELGPLQDQVQSLVPLLDEYLSSPVGPIRIIGVDLLTVVPIDRQAVEGDVQATELQSQSRSLDGIWISPELRDWVLANYDKPINGEIGQGGLLVADIGVAQELLGITDVDRLSYVGVSHVTPLDHVATWLERFMPGASAGLPVQPLPVVDNFRVVDFARQHPANQFGQSVLFNISALSALAMVVAWFLIYQVAVSWLRRLQHVFRRLDVLGCTPHELLAYFVGLLLLVASLAALVGCGVGVWMAQMLLQGVTDSAEPVSIDMDRWVVLKAFGSALLVSLVGGSWAYRAAMPAGTGNRLWQGGLLLLLGGIVIAGLGLPDSALLGAFGAIAALSVMLVVTMPWVIGWLRSFSHAAQGSLLVRMSLREVVWYPRDLSIAISGLSLAVASAIGIGLMIASFRADFEVMLEQRLSYDYQVEGPASALQSLLEHPAALSRRQGYWERTIRFQGVLAEWTVAALDDIEAQRYGHANALAAHEILISEQMARQFDLQTGDDVLLEDAQYIVAGVFKNFGDMTPRLISNVPLMLENFELTEVRLIAADETLVTSLREAFAQLRFSVQADIKRTALATFDRTFVITSVLIAIAIIVAGLGVYIAVTVLRLNQRVSERLLEGLGIRRSETWGIDLARGLGMGLLACCAAVPLGVAIGWILCAEVNPRAFGWSISFQLVPQAVLTPLVWGMLAAMLAGLVRVGLQESGVMREGQVSVQFE